MADRQFDDLTRLLARPISRRQAFKTVTAAAAGALLAHLGSGTARAGGGDDDEESKNSSCTRFCNQLPVDAQRRQCIKDAVKRQGPCYDCGPKGTNKGFCSSRRKGDGGGDGESDSQNSLVCCPKGQDCCRGVCTSLLTSATNCGTCNHACASGQNCVNGTCESICPGPVCASNLDCGPGNVCVNGRCTTTNACVTPSTCGGGQKCGCYTTSSGGTACFERFLCEGQCTVLCPGPFCTCASGQTCITSGAYTDQCTCSSSRDCVGGQVCMNGVCAPCTTSTQCPHAGQVCTNGVCACTRDSHCPAGSACLSNYCSNSVPCAIDSPAICIPFCRAERAASVSSAVSPGLPSGKNKSK